MSRLLLAIATVVLAAVAHAAPPLVTPAELDALRAQPNVRVVDVRPRDAYSAGHVPGAVSAPYGTWRGPAANPGELPPLPKLTSLVQGLGLSPEVHAVVVSGGDDATDFGTSARVYWTLKVLGLKELSILNGGMQAWAAAKLPTDTSTPAVAPSAFVPTIDASLIATREHVASAIEGGKSTLVDARPPAFFEGETRHQAAKVPGTLKGALNVPYSRWFDGDAGTLVAASVAPGAKDVASDGAETVSFCNTGHWAAINWFALSEVAGQKNVRLYPGSMVDWTQDPKALPMDNVPSRAQQLWIDAKLWAARTFN